MKKPRDPDAKPKRDAVLHVALTSELMAQIDKERQKHGLKRSEWVRWAVHRALNIGRRVKSIK